MKMIVEGYLSLKDRTSLEELRNHRQRIRKQLQDRSESANSAFKPDNSLRLFDEDLRVIEAAISRLR